MLRRYYNSREIINPGEALVDGLLSELIYDETNWHVLFGLLLSKNAFNRTGRGECDFVLMCEYGVLVLEVKGGLISYRDAQIIQKNMEEDKERVIDPFGQVWSNRDAVRKTIESKFNRDVFVGEAVIFPQSSFKYVGDSFAHYWHMQSQASLGKFLEQCLKRQAAAFNFEKLMAKEIRQIVDVLVPEVNWEERAVRFDHTRKEAEKRGEVNHKILKGLEGNNRIIIEGPPGSGKSTFAQKFILDKVQKEDLRVLYLCWNEFLAIHAGQFFKEREVDDNVTAMAFFDYVNHLFARHPQNPSQLSFSEVPLLYDHVDRITTELRSVCMLKTYDLIVIDEAQDLFHKGIDLILDRQLNGGMSRGSYIVFYDSLQAFDKGTNAELYQLVYHSIKEASAYYKLYEYFRTIEGSGIANFLDDAMKGSIDPSRVYGGDMVVKTFRSLDDCLPVLKQVVRDAQHIERVAKKDMIVLFSSNLVSGRTGTEKERPLDGALSEETDFEKLENENFPILPEKVRYTTALKYKGLETDFVVLVINDLFNEKIRAFYQMYIGASRAKAKLVLLLDEASARMASKQKANTCPVLLDEMLQ